MFVYLASLGLTAGPGCRVLPEPRCSPGAIVGGERRASITVLASGAPSPSQPPRVTVVLLPESRPAHAGGWHSCGVTKRQLVVGQALQKVAPACLS